MKFRDSYKNVRVGFGIFISISGTGMWFSRPALVPVWAVALAWIFGAGLAFSTVVTSLARNALPFLNRRAVEDLNGSQIVPGRRKHDRRST